MATIKAVWHPDEPSEYQEASGPWVEVLDAKEAHRLFNKGRFGQPLAGGGLRLHPLEATYLEEVGRLELEGEREPVASSQLAAYSDLRERGLVVKPEASTDEQYLLVWSREGGLRSAPHYHLYPVAERATFDLDTALLQAQEAIQRGVCILIGVVDEEGGLTYFELSRPQSPEGHVDADLGVATTSTSTSISPSTTATSTISASPERSIQAILEDELLFVEDHAGRSVLEPKGYGRLIGDRYKLSLLEGLYLAQEEGLGIRDDQGELEAPALAWQMLKRQPDLPLRLAVYRFLRSNGYLPKTGFKFGTHFRLYDRPIGQGHAPWLVHAFPVGHQDSWPELARMVRLTHGVRKKLWLARVTEEAAEAALRGEQPDPVDSGIQLLEVGWVRP